MRIILESTKMSPSHRVEIETDYDDLTIDNVWDDLVRPALIAYGYCERNTDDLVGNNL